MPSVGGDVLSAEEFGAREDIGLECKVLPSLFDFNQVFCGALSIGFHHLDALGRKCADETLVAFTVRIYSRSVSRQDLGNAGLENRNPTVIMNAFVLWLAVRAIRKD